MEQDQIENIISQEKKTKIKKEEDANAYEYDENGRPNEKPVVKEEKQKEMTKGAADVKDIEKEISKLN